MPSLARCVFVGLLSLLACESKTVPAKPAQSGSSAQTQVAQTKATQPAAEPVKQALAKLDAKGAAEGVKSLAAAAEDQRPLLAARALVELENARLGPSFIAGLDGFVAADPAFRAQTVAKAISENIVMLDAVCGTGSDKFMRSLGMMSPEQRKSALWDRCKFAEHGLVSEAEGKAAEPLAIILAHMAYVYLKAHDISDDETTLLKTLASMKPAE